MGGDQACRPPRAGAARRENLRLIAAAAIAPLQSADAEAAARLHAACLSEAWSADSFRELLAQDAITAWKIALGSEILGLLLIRRAADEAELLALVIAESHRRQGLAERLLSYLHEAIVRDGVTRLFLEVRASNQAAIGLYRAAGYTEIARRQAYYPGAAAKEDAIVMQRRV